jgi:hypothetical protein
MPEDQTPPEPERRTRISDWANPQFILTVLSLVVAAALAWGNIKSDIRTVEMAQRAQDERVAEVKVRAEAGLAELRLRIAALEQQREELVELRSDVKYIKEKISKLP